METRLGRVWGVDHTSTFHICNDRGPQKTREKKNERQEQEGEKGTEKGGEMRDEHMKTVVGAEDAGKQASERKRRKKEKDAHGSRGPGVLGPT